jgi:RimJ/RimL family protein N-acetyltransferase
MTLDDAFSRPPSFTTSRLMIRPIKTEDLEAMFAIKSDPEVTSAYGNEPHVSMDETRRWMDDVMAGFKERDSLLWALVPKDQDRAVGSACYWHFDKASSCAEVGYELGRPSWGKGLMTEALGPILEFGFDGMVLQRIEACPLADNAASNNLLLRLGFKKEGTLRRRVRFRGRYIDQAYYGLFREELKRP